MSENGLLILDFETDSGNEYVYDGVTNRVFFTPEPLRKMIRGFKEKEREQMISELSSMHPTEVLEDYYDQVQRWVEIDKAFFLEESSPEQPVPLDRQRRKEFRRPALVIVVTSDCNLRCRYCTQDRVKESMTFDVAKAGIDHFFESNANPDKKAVYFIGVSFYGGEPLLEFDLVRRCAEYVRSKASPWGIPVVFRLTTNGTLLTDEITDFLVKNDIGMAISLDGPKEEHDRNRITKSGTPTFDVVFKNLMHLKQRYPTYYFNSCSVSAVYDYASDLRRVVEWFHENSSVLPPLARASLAAWNEKTCDRFACDVVQSARCRIQETLSMFKDVLITNDQPGEKIHDTWRMFLPQFRVMTNRRHFRVWRMRRPGCHPGLTRLALYPDGTFRACDRIETRDSIGDVNAGIEVKEVDRLMSQFQADVVVARRCRTCIAQHGCQTCYLHTIGGVDTGFSCEGERATLGANLKYWYSIFERNPQVIELFRRGRQTILDEFLG